MALNAGTCHEVRGGSGDNANGGGCRGNGITPAGSAPSTSTATTGGTVAANTYYVRTALANGNGEGPMSAQATQVTTGSTSTLTTVSPTAPSGSYASLYSVYMSTSATGPYWQQSTGNLIGVNYTRTTTPATSGIQPIGVDYSQQNAAQKVLDLVTITATVHTTTTQISILTGWTVDANYVGNLLNINGGTATAGLYEIQGVDIANNRLLLDRSAGTAAQTVVGNIGGALNTLAQAATNRIVGNTVWVKSGTYNETLSSAASSTWIGYDATRGDEPTGTGRPLIDGQSTRTNCISVSGGGHGIFHFRCTGATGAGVNTTQASNFDYVKSSSNGGNGFTLQTACNISFCESASNTGVGFSGSTTISGFCCWSHDNTGIGFAGGLDLDFCVASQNAGHGIDGSSRSQLTNCVAYGNTGTTDGIRVIVSSMVHNCISQNNGRYGFSFVGASPYTMISDYNCSYGNTTAQFSTWNRGPHDVVADPLMVDPGNATASLRDFSLQGGSPCRNVGAFSIPGSLN